LFSGVDLVRISGVDMDVGPSGRRCRMGSIGSLFVKRDQEEMRPVAPKLRATAWKVG